VTDLLPLEISTFQHLQLHFHFVCGSPYYYAVGYNTCFAVGEFFPQFVEKGTQHQQNPALKAVQTLSVTFL